MDSASTSLREEAKKTVRTARFLGVAIGLMAVLIIVLAAQLRYLQERKKAALALVNSAVVSVLTFPQGEPFAERRSRVVRTLEDRLPSGLDLGALSRSPDDDSLRSELRLLATAAGNRLDGLVLLVLVVSGTLLVAGAFSLAGLAIRLDQQAARQAEFQRQAELGIKDLEYAVRFRADIPIRTSSRWKEIEAFFASVQRVASEYSFDRELLDTATSTNSISAMLPRLLEVFGRAMPCDRLSLAFLDQEGFVVQESAVSSGSPLLLDAGYSQRLAGTSLESIAVSGEPRIIADLEARNCGRCDGPNALLLEEGYRSSLTVPLLLGSRCVGFLFLNARRKGAYTADHLSLARRMAALLRGSLYSDYVLQLFLAETSRAFVMTMEKKDDETSLHIRRMSLYSYRIAARLAKAEPIYAEALTPRMLRDILWFSPLHDIGKIGVPDVVLFKAGPLDEAERQVMEQHVNMGIAIFRSLNEGLKSYLTESPLDTTIDIIAGHHEKWDGSGYPRGLAGAAIPLSARIVAAGDVLDALTTARPYKAPWPFDEALSWMRDQSGRHFDPAVVAAAIDIRDELEDIYRSYKDESSEDESPGRD